MHQIQEKRDQNQRTRTKGPGPSDQVQDHEIRFSTKAQSQDRRTRRPGPRDQDHGTRNKGPKDQDQMTKTKTKEAGPEIFYDQFSVLKAEGGAVGDQRLVGVWARRDLLWCLDSVSSLLS